MDRLARAGIDEDGSMLQTIETLKLLFETTHSGLMIVVPDWQFQW